MNPKVIKEQIKSEKLIIIFVILAAIYFLFMGTLFTGGILFHVFTYTKTEGKVTTIVESVNSDRKKYYVPRVTFQTNLGEEIVFTEVLGAGENGILRMLMPKVGDSIAVYYKGDEQKIRAICLGRESIFIVVGNFIMGFLFVFLVMLMKKGIKKKEEEIKLQP